MKRTAAILTLVAVVSLLGASDVRAGAALISAGKTGKPRLIATIVTDVTGGSFADGKGVTTVRVQKGNTNTATVFTSSYVASFAGECTADEFSDVETTTASRFTGLIDGFIDTPAVLEALFEPFGEIPSDAAITDQEDVTCTAVNGRQILSFTAVIRFKKP
jgi:hypothetical protein